MPALEFIGQSTQDEDNVPASASRLINCYREPAGVGGKTQYVLKSVLGTVQMVDLASILGRDLIVVNSVLYAASGGALHKIASNGVATNLGSISDDEDTNMSGYAGNVTIAAGGKYYVYNGTTISTITGGAFTNVGSVSFLGGYTLLTEKNGTKFEWTTLQDPSTRAALNVATAEARDDILLRGIAIAGNYYLFGTDSIEIWYQTGAATTAAFSRLGGGVIDTGLKAKGLIASVSAGAFMVGNDNVPYLLAGAQLHPLFNAAVQTAIEEGTPTKCFYYEDRGHKFCVIRFSDRPAWVFDITSREWHERASGNQFLEWDATASAKAYGSWRTINANSIISTLSRTNQDLGETMIRRAISFTYEADGEPFSPTLEIRVRRGHQATDADIIASFSDDGGETWSAPDPRSIGGLGNFDQRAIWYEGQHESFTARIDIAHAAEIPVYTRAILTI